MMDQIASDIRRLAQAGKTQEQAADALGLHVESLRRRARKYGVEFSARRTRYQGMTPEKAADMRRRYFAREAKQAELAREYGVRQGTVSRIISGLSWSRP